MRKAFFSRPYQFTSAALAAAAGVAQLVVQSFPPSLVHGVGKSLTEVWCVYLVIGGVAAVAGLVKGRPSIEAAGLTLLGSASVLYACAAILYGGWAYAVGTSAWLALAIGHALRLRVIWRSQR